jgi:hypothetical protein
LSTTFKAIGKKLGKYVKMLEATLKGRYTSYARICIDMDVSGALREAIVGAQKCPILILLSLHHSSHFIAPLTFHDIISINILGFHLIVLHFIHFSI